MFTVPFTRGSTMKFLPVYWPTDLITDWMSAFTKLTVTRSPPLLGAGACAEAGNETAVATAMAAWTRARRTLRNVVTYCRFCFDLTGIVRRNTGTHPNFLKGVSDY